MLRLSIIIPTLNEAASIVAKLESLQVLRLQGHEIILVDGGSSDDTPTLAKPLCDRILNSPPGRAKQMNRGAEAGQGGLLLFLHADTHIGANAWRQLTLIPIDSPIWGRFDVQLSGAHPMFRIIERFINIRSRLSGIATGDQAIFVSQTLFMQIGKFPEIPLMEDVALSKKLKTIQAPICLHERVITSSRRWEKHGIIKTILLMWHLRLQFALGVSPERLVKRYYT